MSSDEPEVLNHESKDKGVPEEPSVDSVEESIEVSTSNEEIKELIVEKKKRVSTKKKSDPTENDKEKSKFLEAIIKEYKWLKLQQG